MLSPAAAAAEAAVAAAAGGRHRPAAFLGDDGGLLDDSEEEEEDGVEEETVDSKAAPPGGFNDDSTLSTTSYEGRAAAAASVNSANANPAGRTDNRIPNLNRSTGRAAVAVQGAAAVDDGYPTPQRKRQRTGAPEVTAGSGTVAEAGKPLASLEDSRRLFQRLWTDADEIVILQGFLDFSSRRSAGAAHHHDTGPFYDQIKARLQLDFNKNQLVEKIRRLKKKYRNVVNRMSSGKDYAFKSLHDQVTFELSRKIWGDNVYSRRGGGAGPDEDDDVEDVDLTPHQIGSADLSGVVTSSDQRKLRRGSRKRFVAEVAATAPETAEAQVLVPEAPVEVKVAERHMPTTVASVPDAIEETVRSCLSPMFTELLCYAVGGRMGAGVGAGGLDGLRLSLLPLCFGSNQVNLQKTAVVDEKWRKQQILELEVFSKRMELMQEQIKLILQELRAAR